MGNANQKKPGFASEGKVDIPEQSSIGRYNQGRKRYSETPPVSHSPPLKPFSNKRNKKYKKKRKSEITPSTKKMKRSYSYQNREPPPQPQYSQPPLKEKNPALIQCSQSHHQLWTQKNTGDESSAPASPPMNPFYTKHYEKQQKQQYEQEPKKQLSPKVPPKKNKAKHRKSNSSRWKHMQAYAEYRNNKKKKNQFHYYAEAKIPRRNQIRKISMLFEYKKQLGTGATSRVLLVESLVKPGNVYAIKELHKLHDVNPQMFLRELKILKILTHDTIVSFYDVYMDRISYYILMEYCSGGNLLEKIIHEYTNTKNKQFTEKRVVIYIAQILRSVQFMHSKNVVHRDLKPNNMVFDRKGTDGKLKLIDFGTSEIVSDQKIYPYEQVGTTQFVPPEFGRPRSGSVLKKGDMWAMGIMTYLLLCGKMLFSGASAQDIWRKICRYQDGCINFDRMKVKLSDPGKNFILNLLRKDPRARMSAKQALQHEWISNSKEKAGNNPLGSHILSGIKAYQESNKLQRIMADAILSEMSLEEKKLIVHKIKDRNDVINYLIQYHHSFHHNIDEKEAEIEVEEFELNDGENTPEPEEYYEDEEKQSKPNNPQQRTLIDIIYEDGYERHVDSGNQNGYKRQRSKRKSHIVQQSTESVLSTLDTNHEEMLNQRVHQVIRTVSQMKLSLVLSELQLHISSNDGDDDGSEGDVQAMSVGQFRDIMQRSQKKYNVEHLISELDPMNSGFIALNKIHQFYKPIDTVRSTSSTGANHKFSFVQ